MRRIENEKFKEAKAARFTVAQAGFIPWYRSTSSHSNSISSSEISLNQYSADQQFPELAIYLLLPERVVGEGRMIIPA